MEGGGGWRVLTASGWSAAAAHVVCRQLGWATGTRKALAQALFGAGVLPQEPRIYNCTVSCAPELWGVLFIIFDNRFTVALTGRAHAMMRDCTGIVGRTCYLPHGCLLCMQGSEAALHLCNVTAVDLSQLGSVGVAGVECTNGRCMCTKHMQCPLHVARGLQAVLCMLRVDCRQ